MCLILHGVTNVNTGSGSIDLGRCPRCCCCCHWSMNHTALLPLRWKMVLQFPLSFKESHKGARKHLGSLLGNNRVRLGHMRFSFHLVLSPSVYSLSFFPQKTEITEQDPKASILSPLKMHTYMNDHNYPKVRINCPPKNTCFMEPTW